MAVYRKKPIEITAVQLLWSTWNEMCDHAGVGQLIDGKPMGCYVTDDGVGASENFSPDAVMGLWIPTLEGLMLAKEGDWVIRGVAGELYPCKDEIFRATYEFVSEDPKTAAYNAILDQRPEWAPTAPPLDPTKFTIVCTGPSESEWEVEREPRINPKGTLGV